MGSIRFLVDVCVDVRVARWLGGRGYDAKHLRDEGLTRLPNGDIFAKAVSEDRVVVTHDLDFAEIAALSRGKAVSVIVFRLYNTRLSHVTTRLASVLDDCVDALERGAIVAVEEARHRVRALPIGASREA